MPSKRICKKFHLVYELKGAQKGVDILTGHYGIRRMKIIVDGRRVMRACVSDYYESIACFTSEGFKKSNVLHELYHHIVEKKGLEMAERKEEREAERFVRKVLRRR